MNILDTLQTLINSHYGKFHEKFIKSYIQLSNEYKEWQLLFDKTTYPMCDEIKHINNERIKIENFISWLTNNSGESEAPSNHHSPCCAITAIQDDSNYDTDVHMPNIIDTYFGINRRELEKERHELLNKQREMNIFTTRVNIMIKEAEEIINSKKKD